MSTKTHWLVAMIGCALLILAACSNAPNDSEPNAAANTESENGAQSGEPTENNNNNDNNDADEEGEIAEEEEEITLAIYTFSSGTEDEYRPFLEEQFPHITFEFIASNPREIEEIIAAGQAIDLYYEGTPSALLFLREVGLTRDQTYLIDRHNYDLGLFREGNVESIRSFSAPGTLEALPQRGIPYVMHYNQDIFDEFGVSYPTNDMTWAETIDLARDVTREEDGVDYYGLLPRSHVIARSLLNSTVLDPETDEPLFQSDGFIQKWTETWDTLYSIPGNVPDDSSLLMDSRALWNEGRLAMHPTWEQLNVAVQMEEEIGMQSDIVTFPQWEEYPGLTPEADTHVVGVAEHTEHEDAAFEVLEYMVSPEYHYDNPQFATSARLAFADQDILDGYETPPEYDHFSLDVFHELANAPGPAERSRFEADAREEFFVNGTFLEELAYEGKDVNTLLREYDERAEELVRQLEEME